MGLTLVGGYDGNGIVVQDAFGIELYIKGLTDYYRLTCLYNPTAADASVSRVYSSDTTDNQNLFSFTLTPSVGTSGAAFIPSELSYDQLFTGDSSTDFTASDIYIKNGSPLHNYLINKGYDEYINTNLPYLYFGRLYPSGTYNIIFIETYFMKDYALDALPEVNRTNNMREFFGVAFDEVYSQIYYKIRNILNLSDPYQTNVSYLHYLLESYGTTSILSSGSVNYGLERFYIANLPSLLKRKGTYDLYSVIFKIITNTTNRLNIYEQWHSPLPLSAPSGSINIREYCTAHGYTFQEHLYTDYYPNLSASNIGGAGARFYSNTTLYPNWASGGSLILSPHFRAEIDLSTAPINVGSIIDETTADLLIAKFNEFRPVSRFIEYSIVVGIKADFTGNYIDTYNGQYPESIKTRCITPVYKPLTGCYIYTSLGLPITTINISHNLGTENILVQVYSYSAVDASYSQIQPGNMIVKDVNTIEVSFGTPTAIAVLIFSNVSLPSGYYPITQFPLTSASGSIDPYPIVMVTKDTSAGYRYEMFPQTHFITQATSAHSIGIPVSASGYAYNEMSFESTYTCAISGSTTYQVYHNLGTQAVIVDVFKYSGGILTKVLPVAIKLLSDYASMSIEVIDTSTYYVTARKLTNYPYIDTKDNVLDTLDHVLIGNGTTGFYNPLFVSSEGLLESEIPSGSYNIKSFMIYRAGVGGFDTDNLEVVLDTYTDINITEVGVFGSPVSGIEDKNKMVFYTKCSNIFVAAGVRVTLYFTLYGTSL